VATGTQALQHDLDRPVRRKDPVAGHECPCCEPDLGPLPLQGGSTGHGLAERDRDALDLARGGPAIGHLPFLPVRGTRVIAAEIRAHIDPDRPDGRPLAGRSGLLRMGP